MPCFRFATGGRLLCVYVQSLQGSAISSGQVRVDRTLPCTSSVGTEMDEGENTDSIDRRKEDKRRQRGQTVPVLNLYQGRHELPYSRVFNS